MAASLRLCHRGRRSWADRGSPLSCPLYPGSVKTPFSWYHFCVASSCIPTPTTVFNSPLVRFCWLCQTCAASGRGVVFVSSRLPWSPSWPLGNGSQQALQWFWHTHPSCQPSRHILGARCLSRLHTLACHSLAPSPVCPSARLQCPCFWWVWSWPPGPPWPLFLLSHSTVCSDAYPPVSASPQRVLLGSQGSVSTSPCWGTLGSSWALRHLGLGGSAGLQAVR